LNAKYLEKYNNARIMKVNDVKVISNKGSEIYRKDLIDNIQLTFSNEFKDPLILDINREKFYKKYGKYEEDDKLFKVNSNGETTVEMIKTIFKD
jgi:hypothetical protein